ncbi:methyltransferase domain-containing protein [Candidatus Beckwithbacteria bacterium]|nr:methyltransferase domain-containing protein [Candidatus Beckwithbacteria bacterium]
MNKNSIDLYNQFVNSFRNYSSTRKKYLNQIDSLIINFINTNIEGKIINILDVGCGDGVRAYNLSKKIKLNKLSLLDNCPNMVKKCEKLKDVTLYNQDIVKLKGEILKNNFEVITCLWNVIGHIEGIENRSLALKNMRKILNKNGYIFLDVSNRYNLKHYGLKIVLKNVVQDLLKKNPNNGDVYFNMKVDQDKIIPTKVHFFTLNEIKKMFKASGLNIYKILFIDYKSGKIMPNQFLGQIFVIAKN